MNPNQELIKQVLQLEVSYSPSSILELDGGWDMAFWLMFLTPGELRLNYANERETLAIYFLQFISWEQFQDIIGEHILFTNNGI